MLEYFLKGLVLHIDLDVFLILVTNQSFTSLFGNLILHDFQVSWSIYSLLASGLDLYLIKKIYMNQGSIRFLKFNYKELD